MVDICLPSPNWSKHPNLNNRQQRQRHQQQQQQQHPEQKPTYNAANGQPQGAQQPLERPTPPSSNNSSRYNVDSLGSGTSTKSCLSIFGMGSFKKASVYSSGNSSSQSSHHPTTYRPPNKLAATIQQDDFAQTWEAFHQNSFDDQADQQQQQQQYDNHHGTAQHAFAGEYDHDDDGNDWQFGREGQEDIGSFANLLQPPKPTDRSHKQRLRLEQEKRKSGVYDGELEPEGKRGQEASVVIVAGSGSAATSTPMRTFHDEQQQQQQYYHQQQNNHHNRIVGRNSLAAARALAQGGRVSPPELQQAQHLQAPPPPLPITPAPSSAAPLVSIKQPQLRPLETIAEMSESRMSESRASDTSSWSSHPQHSSPARSSRQQQQHPPPLNSTGSPSRDHHHNSPPRNNHNHNNSQRRYHSPRTISPRDGSTIGSSSRGGSQQYSPARSVDPPGNNSFESASTSSDEDISKMMSDFLRSSSNQNNNNTGNSSSPSFNSSLMEREYPNPIHMPRSYWTPSPQSPPRSIRHKKKTSGATSAQHHQQHQPPQQRHHVQPITVSRSSSGDSSNTSVYVQERANRISPDPSASSYSSPPRRGIAPISTATGSFSSEDLSSSRMVQQSSQHSQSSQPQQQQQQPQPSPILRQASRSRRQILPPPQNQHASPERSNASSTRSQRSSSQRSQRSSQPDPEGRLSPSRAQAVSSPTRSPKHPYTSSHFQPTAPPTTTNSNQIINQEEQQPQSIDAWNALALQHVHNGEYDMALAAFQHVLRAYKQQYGNVHPLVASAYHNLGTVHAKRAQLLLDDTLHQRHCRAQSLQCFQSAARAARDSLGRDHPNVAVSLVRIGFLLLQARQYNNAVITFQEALRIRQAHYGPHHALVANLYNNLGVCYMHLGQFAHGRDLLHHALTIQRTLLEQAQEEVAAADEKKDSSSVPTTTTTTTSQALELADTLFNIGGLALEWIRRQGPDVRHAEDAEEAFEEALELRKSVLGPKDPMVLQVKSLLDMARSIPRPKSPGRKGANCNNSTTAAAAAKPTKGNGNINFQPPSSPQTPNHHHYSETSSRPPDPIGLSPNTASAALPNAAVRNRGNDNPNANHPPQQEQEQEQQLSPRRSARSQKQDDTSSLSPYQAYIRRRYSSDSASPIRQRSSSRSPPSTENNNSQPSSQQQQQQQEPQPQSQQQHNQHQQQRRQERSSSSSSPIRYNAKADYLEPPRVTRRSLLDQADSGGAPPEKPRHALSPTMNSQTGRMSLASSSASTVKIGSPARQQRPPPREQRQQEQQRHHQEPHEEAEEDEDDNQASQKQSVFRSQSNRDRKKKNDATKLPPPITEIAVSQDEEDDGLYDPATLPRPAHTNIFISPHYVPNMSPHKVNHHTSTTGDDTPRSVASSSYSGVPISNASNNNSSAAAEVGVGAIQKTYSYDPEEQLVLTDGLGTADNPLPDDYDAMPSSSKDSSGSTTRKIMVVRPYRSTPDESITSPTSVISSRAPWDLTTTTEEANTGGGLISNSSSSLYSSELDYSSKTTSYGRDASKNNARSETLNRARALLQAHSNPDYLDSPQVQLSGQPSFLKNSPNDRVKQQLFRSGKQEGSFDEDLEDGLAPLGVNDSILTPSSSPNNRKSFHPDMLTNNPDEHLREIYEEASRCLKNHHYDEAQEYFGTILQCQRHLHGPFHHDVAAALHNCGLAQLRAGNNHQALKSFEEAVRIRKGTLGSQHPHVAVSLVKCGITFLLLHRFEEALWSFREALSIRKHSLGTLHPSTARIYNNIGCVHIEFNELREARRAFEGALDIQRNALCHDPESGPVRFGAAATLCNLGYLYRYRGMHERASQVLREAADIQEEILGGTHPTVLSTLDSLAEALASSGKAAEAYVTQETILDRFQTTETAGSRRLLRAEAGLKYKMSKSAKQMNDRERHIKNLQQALQAVRSLDEQTESARKQATGLEKRILSDLREARNGEATNELNWI